MRIATRASRLALAQARWVADRISRVRPMTAVSLVEVSTTGDRDRTTSVSTLTEVGAFVRAVQRAVLDGDADLAVHSCKDLPVEGPDGLVSFYPGRESPWDVLCGHDLEALPEGGRVGTGSPRRAAQMLELRPDIQIQDVRGNVDTRLAKVAEGELDAVVLAEAGLRRIGLEDQISHRMSLAEMVPAPGQAALAVQAPEESPFNDVLEVIDDPRTRLAVEAERALLELSDAGCRSALGAFADLHGDVIQMTGFVSDDDGARRGHAAGAAPRDVARGLLSELGL